MRRNLCMMFVICALALVTVSPATAITNHNLHWGFEVGDQFHYSVSGVLPIGVTLGFTEFYVEIEQVPTIPADVSSSMDLSYNLIAYSFYFENGTEMDQYYYTLWTALPVGNWSIITELLGSNSYYETTVIDTATEWGLTYTNDFGGPTQTTTIKLSKVDGVLNFYSITTVSELGIASTSTVTRKDGGLSLPALLIGGGSAIVIVAVVVLIYMNKRQGIPSS